MIIYDEFDIQISIRDGNYFMRYDEGEIVVQYTELQITKEDAEKVMEDVNYAITLVLDYQNKLWGLV